MARKEVRDFATTTRDDLGATLDEIEHRLSPKELGRQGVHWVSRSYDKNPVAWLVGIGVTAVGSIAAILWALSRDD